jgi:hypothetical protein
MKNNKKKICKNGERKKKKKKDVVTVIPSLRVLFTQLGPIGHPTNRLSTGKTLLM